MGTGICRPQDNTDDGLTARLDSDYAKLKDTRADVSELQKIRKCVDIALRADQPEQTQTRTKRHDIDR